MNGQSVVRRYAEALYKAGKEASLLKTLDRDMKDMNRLFREAPEIRSFCLHPSSSPEKNRLFIETALLPYLSELTGRTVEILCSNDRLEALPYMPEMFDLVRDKDKGIISVRIESAQEQSPIVKKQIKNQLQKRLGGEIRTDWQIKKEILGGFTFQWNNRMIDLSLKGRFQHLRNLLQRNG